MVEIVLSKCTSKANCGALWLQSIDLYEDESITSTITIEQLSSMGTVSCSVTNSQAISRPPWYQYVTKRRRRPHIYWSRKPRNSRPLSHARYHASSDNSYKWVTIYWPFVVLQISLFGGQRWKCNSLIFTLFGLVLGDWVTRWSGASCYLM